ncbi:hypothetical protein BDZ94DRAFT_173503 [Collybia nuda]|uniref:Uncharacterized protein n=1 Tax=Collybia nuda TaxID=64659 RepID=A0A9P5YCZ7_9AGAR|nr:hypothetical protein BDZ94DRAFT_173503 [Collybia nuda]
MPCTQLRAVQPHKSLIVLPKKKKLSYTRMPELNFFRHKHSNYITSLLHIGMISGHDLLIHSRVPECERGQRTL